jgi:phage terminase large subunit
METVGYAMLEINRFSKSVPVHVWIDDSGVGGGVTDRLQELNQDAGRVYVAGINNGSKSHAPDDYVNMGTELWHNMSDHIAEWDIPDDEDLVGQLTSRKFKMTSKGQIALESKDDMKARGLDSPDKADALSLAFIKEVEKNSVILDL